MSKIELLAPAGSLEALYAAAENGADAVYFGGQMFNARQNAANFTIEEMNEAVSYLHKKGSRSLLTLNTLIGNHEILDLLDYIYEVAACGVDGVIVQDLGVVEILKETLPELSLHASTQMAVHNWQGVKYLEDLGFKRAVLARAVLPGRNTKNSRKLRNRIGNVCSWGAMRGFFGQMFIQQLYRRSQR